MPNKFEHPPTGQDLAMISPYERYPENSMPAMAIIRMILSARNFFIVRKKKIKKIALLYTMKEKKQIQRETR